VKKRDELVAKAKAGKLIEPKTDAPPKSENVRTFNVFIDNEYFSVEVDPTGDFQPMVAPAAVLLRAAAAAPKAAAARLLPLLLPLHLRPLLLLLRQLLKAEHLSGTDAGHDHQKHGQCR
jgi:hypothetical protein